MKVRFRKQYSDSEPRMAYELVSETIGFEYCETEGKRCNCYNVKGLGFVPARKMEITNDPTNQPAIDVFVKLSNL